MADDRIAKLSERFGRHQGARPAEAAPARTRERRSLYLDGALLERIDREHRAINHRLYPRAVNKAAFLEALIEYGFDHLDELAEVLASSATGKPPAP